MMKKLLYGVRRLLNQELAIARHDNGHFFNSPHEGYGVILEELDEAQEENYKLVRATERLLGAIRRNNRREIETGCFRIEDHATRAACELIQTAAMARKMRESLEEVTKNA